MLDKYSSAAASVVFTSYCVLFSALFKEGKMTFIHVNTLYEMVFTLVALYLKELDLVDFYSLRQKKKEDNQINIELYEYMEAMSSFGFGCGSVSFKHY